MYKKINKKVCIIKHVFSDKTIENKYLNTQFQNTP